MFWNLRLHFLGFQRSEAHKMSQALKNSAVVL